MNNVISPTTILTMQVQTIYVRVSVRKKQGAYTGFEQRLETNQVADLVVCSANFFSPWYPCPISNYQHCRPTISQPPSPSPPVYVASTTTTLGTSRVVALREACTRIHRASPPHAVSSTVRCNSPAISNATLEWILNTSFRRKHRRSRGCRRDATFLSSIDDSTILRTLSYVRDAFRSTILFYTLTIQRGATRCRCYKNEKIQLHKESLFLSFPLSSERKSCFVASFETAV